MKNKNQNGNQVAETAFDDYWEAADAYGMQVSDGKLCLAGSPYHGMGTNFYNLFNNGLRNSYDKETSFAGLQVLAENNVPYVRFNCGVYYYNELHLYFQDKTTYFDTLKAIATEAARLRIGLIPSFFWAVACVPDYFDEPIRAWGDKESLTREFMRTYTAEVVNALKGSKALWGWEFGNEFNLAADLPNAADHIMPLPANSKRTSRDKSDHLKGSDINSAFKEFAQIVRANDPHNRFITSGNADLRASQYNQWESFGTSWKADTEEEHFEITKYLNPAAMNTVSEHLYFTKHAYFNREFTLKEHVQMTMQHCAENMTPLIVGEFGHNNNLEPLPEESQRLESARKMALLFMDNYVQLFMIWNFSPVGTTVEYSFNEQDERGKFLLALINEINTMYFEPRS